MSKLRLYAFCNFYLNSISQGIQTAHVVGKMARNYRNSESLESQMFWEWLDRGNETIIVCNGGMGADIYEAYHEHMDTLSDLGIPSSIFYEEPRAFGTDDNCNLAPTCWACVLPEEMYDAKCSGETTNTISGKYEDKIHELANFTFDNEFVRLKCESDDPLFDFLTYKNKCGLAR